MKRRARRPDDGRFLERDARLWRRLLKQVRYIVRAPLADTAPLFKAAHACGRAVPPPGQALRGSPFLAIVLQGRAFGNLAATDKPARAAELGQLAEAVEAVLNLPVAGRPARADIFG